MRSPTSNNFFDLVRLTGAIMVIVGHSYTITDYGSAPRVLGIPIHTLGVYIFFATSGFLVQHSLLRGTGAEKYLKNRVRRIFPGLVFITLVTALIIGPIISAESHSRYFASAETYKYLLNIFLIGQYTLPGVFDGDGSRTVNGSLWTLWPECLAYALLLIAWLISKKNSSILVTVTFIIAPIAIIILLPEGHGVSKVSIPLVYFGAGALLAISSHLITRAVRIAIVITAATLWLITFALKPEFTEVAAAPIVALIIVSFGRSNWPGARTYRKILGDPTYGCYLWGYFIQQILARTSLIEASFALYVAVCTVSALAAGVVSWRLVERRFIERHRHQRSL